MRLFKALGAWWRSRRRRRPSRRRPVAPSLSALEGRRLLTHFRYGNLAWEPSDAAPNAVTFHLQQAFRRDFFILHPDPQPGDIIEDVDPFDFGDGSDPAQVTIRVLSVDPAQNFLIGEAVHDAGGTFEEGIPHTYAEPGQYTAFVQSGDRLSELRNNADFSYRIATRVFAGVDNASPVSGIAPIVQAVDNSVVTVPIPAVDPDGDALRFRLADTYEASGGQGYVPPTGLTISADGTLTWDIRDSVLDTQPGDLWTTQVIVEDLDASGNVVSSIPLDFLLQVVQIHRPPMMTPPVIDAAPAGALPLTAGVALNFTVQASDADFGNNVTLLALNPPRGMTFQDVPPQIGSRPNARAVLASFTPSAAQAAQGFVIAFQARDGTGLTVQRAVVLVPGTLPPANQPPAARANGPYEAPGGNAIVLSSAGSSDPDGTIVLYEWDFDFDGAHFQADAKGAAPTFPSGLTGQRTVALRVTDNRGARALSTATVRVGSAPPPGTLSGDMLPSSDTGASDSDRVTFDNTPTFAGAATPGSIVVLAASRGTEAPFEVGRTTVDPAGRWAITTAPLADGAYNLSATLDAASPPTFPLGPLLVDTVGPRITSLGLRPRSGLVLIGVQDDRSGLDDASLAVPSNYGLMLFNRPRRPLTPTNVMASAGGPTEARLVSVEFNRGRRLVPGRRYVVTVRPGGIADLAGNPLDGEFRGTLSSGDGQSGGTFQARTIVTPRGNRPLKPLSRADLARIARLMRPRPRCSC
jgi:hypothetical protein